MSVQLAANQTLFNPDPQISVVALGQGQQCYVIDDALVDPMAMVDLARTTAFEAPRGFPYPGVVAQAPASVVQRMADFFAQHVRGRMGARRTLDLTVRMSLVTLAPNQLAPLQWQCHRDRVADDPMAVLFAASVLYLFRDPALGGTSFYVPRLPRAEMNKMIADSQMLDAAQFTTRYGVQPGYMAGSNAYFECVATVPAAWNRLIFYDGGMFHSADVTQPSLLNGEPAAGRLTLNGFMTCKRATV